MKGKRGITLIALVIIVVVLIILAVAAINLSMGENGLFNRAKFAKESYQNAENSEKQKIDQLTNEVSAKVSASREQVLVDKDEYDALKTTVSALSARIDELTDTNLNNNTNSLISNRYRAGSANIGAVTGDSRYAYVDVVFSTPMPNTNYSVSVIPKSTQSGWAAMSYNASSKTVNGFRIGAYVFSASVSHAAHSVDWIAIANN